MRKNNRKKSVTHLDTSNEYLCRWNLEIVQRTVSAMTEVTKVPKPE